MANLCKEIFKLDKIGINDNFFSLGATSFNMIQLTNKLQEVFKKDIPVLTLFEYPTISSFLGYIELEVPAPGDSREEEDWMELRKQGQNKFKKLRKKRKIDEEFENV
jgi:acyl carrier protein